MHGDVDCGPAGRARSASPDDNDNAERVSFFFCNRRDGSDSYGLRVQRLAGQLHTDRDRRPGQFQSGANRERIIHRYHTAHNGYGSDATQYFTLTVNKVNQATLTVSGPSSVTYGATGTATVSGGSGTGALSFSAGSSTGCSVTGTTVSVSNASGTCELTATQAADNNYNAATSGAFAVALKPASLAITATSGLFTYGGTPPTITATYNGFVNGETQANLTTPPTCSTTATSTSPAGWCLSPSSSRSAAWSGSLTCPRSQTRYKWA